MKKMLLMLVCLLLLSGCAPSEHDLEKEVEREMELEEIKREIYREAYEEGYRDAMDLMIDEMPWYLVDMEELEEALSMIFDDEAYAEEIRDQISSYCEVYECVDFKVAYSESGMDYDY